MMWEARCGALPPRPDSSHPFLASFCYVAAQAARQFFQIGEKIEKQGGGQDSGRVGAGKDTQLGKEANKLHWFPKHGRRFQPPAVWDSLVAGGLLIQA